LRSTVVVDIDEKAGEMAEQAGHRYFCGRIEDFESDTKFDFVLMLNLIEHVKDPVTVLRKIRDLTSDDGIILIKTPNYDSLDGRLFRNQYWGGLHCPRHWVLFTPESFRRAVERAGLSIQMIKLTQGAPFWSWSVLHLLNRLRLVKVSRAWPMYKSGIVPFLFGAFAVFDLLRSPVMRTSQIFVVLQRGA
jgi:SAM-dependent methyltransferase